MNTRDVEALEQALPVLRTLMAFILRVRSPLTNTAQTYAVADEYLKQLKKDMP